MPKCIKSGGQAIDYASKLLSPEEVEPFEEHLKSCPDCTEAVQSFRTVLQLTDTAQAELRVPELALQDIEMNVYKRLAAAHEQTLLSRVRSSIANFGSLFRWYRIAAAASTIVIAIITITLLWGRFFPDAVPPLPDEQSAVARIEQYRQQDIQRNLEEALITHHLRNDAWDTESQLYRMKEQADGTDWMAVADAHLQNLQSGTLNTP